MLRLRRLTALVLNLLLIQVSLAGYGRTCVEGGNSVSPATNTMAMAHAPGVPDDAERVHDHCAAEQSCPRPWTPDGCAARAACVAPALPARVVVTPADAPAGDRHWADAALMRQGPRAAPDLPPPRA